MAKHEMWELQQMQALPLKLKIRLTQQRIREWVNEFGLDGVYISFSGGKDSTVLLHIARQMYPEIKAVFSNTGLEFPETVNFVKTFDNVDFVKPKMSYMSVIKKYGYPLISKEVSECVWGARKYLTSVIESEMALTDRQTQNLRINGISRNIVSCADAASMNNLTRGGYDNKYRKLRGVGNYATSSNIRNCKGKANTESLATCKRTTPPPRGSDEKIRFAKLTGTLTTTKQH